MTRVGTAATTPPGADVAQVHDYFTGSESISYEELGFAERFGGCKLVEAEVTSIGGELPVHTSGGLRTGVHPPGGTGVAQHVELDGVLISLAHTTGAPTAVSAVTILEGPVAHGG